MPTKITSQPSIPLVPEMESIGVDRLADGGDELFAVDRGATNLKSKAIRGGAVTFIAQGIRSC